MHAARAWSWAALVAGIVLVGLGGGAPADESSKTEGFFFKPKDRIVFLGDSITEQTDYTNFLEYYLVTRFPAWDLVCFNAGIGGDTAGGGNGRAARDVLSEKPTAVTINFGMNDGRYRGPDAGIYNDYVKNQEALVKRLTDAGARVALMATSPVEGRKRKDGETYNETLGKFCAGLRDIAGRYNATHVDQFHPAQDVLKKMAEDKAPFDCFPDSVHTNGRGGLLMAWAILTALHAPPVVSDVSMKADGTVLSADTCKVSGVDASGGKLAFSRADEAIPLALTKDQKQLLPYLDSLSALNRYGLKVAGLEKGTRYQLKIDGKRVGDYSFTGEDLAKGVNLALYDLGPITKQSEGVAGVIANKNRLLRYRFDNFRRNSPTPPGLSEEEKQEFVALRKQELAVVDRALEARRKEVYEMARPKAHTFELSPAP
jgi:lysophospholipase L1-like esterase